jgi:hypothetical protein
MEQITFIEIPSKRSAGRCSVCGRPLTDPESLSRGMGPICGGKSSTPENVTRNYTDDFIDDVRLTEALVLRRSSDGRPQTNVPHLAVAHSPTGFEFGYGGSGPADLALNAVEALLIEIGFQGPRMNVNDGSCFCIALTLHQDFKWQFIAKAPREGARFNFSEIKAWVESHIGQQGGAP